MTDNTASVLLQLIVGVQEAGAVVSGQSRWPGATTIARRLDSVFE